MSTRKRKGSAFAKRRLRIIDDDDESEEIGNVDSVTQDDASNSKFGGVLASLNNKPALKTKGTKGYVRAPGSNKKNKAPKSVVSTPQRTTRSATKQHQKPEIETPGPPPSSIRVDKAATAKGVSPLTVQKRPTTNRYLSSDSEDDDSGSQSESDESSSSAASSDDDKTQDMSSVEEKTSKSKGSEEFGDESEDEEEDGEEEELDVDDESSEDVENYDDDDASSKEFEFKDDDEEFVPEDDDASYGDESSDHLSDFIVDEDTPPKKKRTQRKSAKKPTKNSKQNVSKKETRETTPGSSKSANDEIPEVCSPKSKEDESSSKSETQQYFLALAQTPKSEQPEVQSTVGKSPEHAESTSSPTSAFIDIPGTEVEDDKHVSVAEDSPNESDVDDCQALSFHETPTAASDGGETEVEETPAKFRLPCKALDFDSPEPLMAMVVDDDDDADDLDDALVATIVDEDVLQNDEKHIPETTETIDEVALLTTKVANVSIREEKSSSPTKEESHPDVPVVDNTSVEEKTTENKENERENEQSESLPLTSPDEISRSSPEKQVEPTPAKSQEVVPETKPKTIQASPKATLESIPEKQTSESEEKSFEIETKSVPLATPEHLTHSNAPESEKKLSETKPKPCTPSKAVKSESEEKLSETKQKSRTPSKSVNKSAQKDKYYRQEGKVPRGKWTLGAKIGVGSFGEVFVGMNTQTGVLMAVKKFVMKGAVMKDIRTEVELLRSLNHKNIVRYYGAQMDRKNLHIFQEWVPGGSVASLLSKFGPFSTEVIQSYLSQTLAGLAYLHENEVMHRDIKGSNILVNDEGNVKLADFGASKKLANLQENLMMSLTVRGTPYFMAPEVFEEKYSAKADIWGIGCVAYQMVTGQAPWKDQGYNNPISLFNHIKKTNGPPPMTHPEYDSFSKRQRTAWNLFEELVKVCFDHDPSKRPTAPELQNDPFFLTVHDVEDENENKFRGLFSPGDEYMTVSGAEDTASPGTFGKEQHSSPMKSPSVLSNSHSPHGKLSRSKSVVQWKSSFMTPPRPKRTPRKGSPSPHKSSTKKTPRQRRSPQGLSPSPDSREWPEWAREQLQKQVGSDLSSIDANESVNDVVDISNMMDSLALSKDSTEEPTPRQPKDRKSTSTIGTTGSNLVGLKFLDSSSATFEI